MGFKKDMTHNPGNDTIIGNHHESVRTGPRNNVYLPSQDQMIINFCLFMDLYYVPQKKKRNILSIQLNGWITSKNYQLSRDNKNWNELNI